MVVAEPDLLPIIVGPATELGIPKDRILTFGDDSKDGYRLWRTLFDHGESGWPRFDELETSKSTTLARLFSSGTTGLPKAANLSHYNLIAEHRLFTEWQAMPWDARRIVILPMSHAATAPLAHYASLRSV
jgi:long-subunit acyl-CoA synthetase (AMP-forming)